MKIKALTIVLALALILCACGASEPVAYTHPTGLQITMPEGFSQIEPEGFLGGYDNRKLGVSLLFNEELYESMANAGLDPELTLEEYGQLILDAYGMEGSTAVSEYGNHYIRYDQVIEGIPFTYIAYHYQNDVAFWSLTFALKTEDVEALAPEIAQWASTVQLPTQAINEVWVP